MNSDLISRSTLKEEMEKADATAIDYESLVDMYERLVDNAPTVETDIEVVAKDAYEQGYADGWKERFGEPNERPQGEWVLMYCSCGDKYYTCSICNRAIEVGNGQSLKDYPFCHCGADMRKGGAENE